MRPPEDLLGALHEARTIAPPERQDSVVWSRIRKRRKMRRAVFPAATLAIGVGAFVLMPNIMPGTLTSASEGSEYTCTAFGECFPESAPGEWSLEAEELLRPWGERLGEAGMGSPNYGNYSLLYEPPGIELVWYGDLSEELAAVAEEMEANDIRFVHTRPAVQPARLVAAYVELTHLLPSNDIRFGTMGIAPGYRAIRITVPGDDEREQERILQLVSETVDVPIVFGVHQGESENPYG